MLEIRDAPLATPVPGSMVRALGEGSLVQGASVMSISIANIYRYPVKGLGGIELDEVSLSVEEGFPFDRRWALAHDSSAFDSANPSWVPCQEFLRLSRDEKLGLLTVGFDEKSSLLTLYRGGKKVSRGKLDDFTGRTLIESFLTGFLPAGPRGKPKIVEAPKETSFTDVEGASISIINLASVKDIERVARQPIDPRRFRGNLTIGGARPWEEFEWVGKTIRIGEVALKGIERIDRCSATNVDPANGRVDINLPLTLRQGFGHIDCGLRCEVLMGGTIKPGDEVIVA